jgi:hypothetical protein
VGVGLGAVGAMVNARKMDEQARSKNLFYKEEINALSSTFLSKSDPL